MSSAASNLVEGLQSQVNAIRSLKCSSARPRFFPCVPEFVLKHGSCFESQSLPRAYRAGLPKRCFHNSRELAKKRGLVYVEGYATGDEIAYLPVLHAWCVEPGSNKVIDITSPILTEYWGVPFTEAAVDEHWAQYGRKNASLLDNWEAGWPLLKLTKRKLSQLIWKSATCLEVAGLNGGLDH